MGAFLRKLWSYAQKPETIVFYNSGVMLLAQGSPCMDALDGLFQAGVDLVACGTCVAHYQLRERLAFGRVSDMQEIVSLLMQAEKVITV
jgi:intracellular sulfur oxidation DsrE/DsrF family protein